jgi:hypothetical protein
VLAETGMVDEARQSDAVRQVLADAGLVGGLELVESIFAGGAFHSEQLNVIAPSAPWCDAGAGHFVSFCPCDYHPGSGCRRRADLV